MNILIIGGTGVISSDVCKKAINNGDNVYMLNRAKRKDKMSLKSHLIIGDIKKESVEEITNKLCGYTFDVVVDFLSYNVKQLKKTVECTPCKQYIFVSSATVYEKQGDSHIYCENDPKGNRGWDYCSHKYDCELELEKLAREKRFHFTIVRPYVTYNETRFPYQISPVEYYTIVDRIKRGRPIPICGNKQTTVTDAGDFAIGMVGLFMNPKAFDQAFHITTDKTTTWRHIAESLANCYGKKCTFVDIPEKDLENISNTIIDISEILLDKGRVMKFNNDKIKNAVPNFSAEIEIDQSIQNIFNYFETGKNLKINYLWAGCMDRLMKKYMKNSAGQYNFNNMKERVMYLVGYSNCLCSIYLFVRRVKCKFKGE